MAWLSLLHTPIVAEQALPFAVLFGAMIAFLNLSRKLELVVAQRRRRFGLAVPRAARCSSRRRSVSSPSLYNPLSTAMKRQADRIEAKLFGAAARPNGWGLDPPEERRRPIDPACRRPRTTSRRTLLHVQVFNFGPDGAFAERVDAETAPLEDGYWDLDDAKIVTPGFDTLSTAVYLLATTLTRTDVAQAFVAPETVSFWGLRELAEQVESRRPRRGRPIDLQYQQLLALPLAARRRWCSSPLVFH